MCVYLHILIFGEIEIYSYNANILVVNMGFPGSEIGGN